MRVFMVCADPGIAPDGTKGASVHLRSVAHALVRAGHDITLLSARLPELADRLAPIAIHRFEGPDSILEVARSGLPDLVYERYALGQEEGLAAARRLGSPFALEVNAPLVLEATRHRPQTVLPRHQEAERRLFRGADVVFTVSRPLHRLVAEVRGTDRGTALLHNGCSPDLFPDPAPLDGDGTPTIVFLGHPKPWHGADALPGLLRDLDRRGLRARLLLVGGGPGARRVEAESARLGLADRVEVTGPLPSEESARRLLEGTVAVAPYPPHPFFYFCPIKVIEYMAAGLPVVATAQGDLPEVLGGTGVLVPPGDAHALALAVQTLIESPSLRQTVGARARARAISELTWDAVAARLIAGVGRALADRAVA